MAKELLLWSALLAVFIVEHTCNCQKVPSRLLPNSTSQGTNPILIASNGTFMFGLISRFPNKWYLGISYNIVDDTNIWLANRNTSVASDATVSFTADGNLILSDSKQGVVWMTGTANLNVSYAELLESGNLALRKSDDTIVWQSFDHPSDTWLPGMKMRLGYKLVSWRSRIDPAPGTYSMTLRPSSEYVSLWNDRIQYWTSGVWTNNKFSAVPQMTESFIYNFTYVKTPTDQYFDWSEKYGNSSHFTLGSDGVIRVSIIAGTKWYNIFTQPEDICSVEQLCGPYGLCSSGDTRPCSCPSGFQPQDSAAWNNSDWSAGCVPTSKPTCDASDITFVSQQASYKEANMTNPLTNVKDARQCEKLCKNDCNCVGYTFDTSCVNEHGPLINGEKSTSGIVLLKVASTGATKGGRNSTTLISVCAASGAALLVAVLVAFFLAKRRRSYQKASSGLLTTFSYKELQKATKNFSQKLGHGGFGAVYKGVLPDKTSVAVKRLDNLTQGEREFQTEVRTLGSIQHINLVRLWGFCAEGSQRLLVYEYMETGSLDKVLFSATVPLDWETRYSIALGTARALAYLHEECRSKIIHCDIKPENILLDCEFRPKVSDFGLAKLLGREISRVITHMRGTRGYLAPEWLSNLPVTTKADVYSYGMTLLEIIGGRRNVDAKATLERWYFPVWAYEQLQSENVASVADPKLGGVVDAAQVERAVKVAISCIQDDDDCRPAMSMVVQMLEGTLEAPMPSLPKALRLMDVGGERGSGTTQSSSGFHLSFSSRDSSATQQSASSETPQSGTMITDSLVAR